MSKSSIGSQLVHIGAMLPLVATLLVATFLATSSPLASGQQAQTQLEGPYVERVIYSIYGNPEAADLALVRGEVDMLGFPLQEPEAEALSEASDVNVEVSPSSRTFMSLRFNVREYDPEPPGRKGSPLTPEAQEALQNPQFRKAFIHILGDRSQLVKPIFGDLATPQFGILPLGFGDWVNPEVELAIGNRLPEQDFQKANEILDTEGFEDVDGDGFRETPSGKELKLVIRYVRERVQDQRAAEILAAWCRENVKLNIVTEGLEFLAFRTTVINAKLWDLRLETGERTGAVPDTMWRSLYSMKSSPVVSGLVNSTLETLIDDLDKAPNLEEAKDIIYDIQEVLMDNFVETMLCTVRIASGHRTDKFEGWLNHHAWGIAGLSVGPWNLLSVRLKDGNMGGTIRVARLADLPTTNIYHAASGSDQNVIHLMSHIYEPLLSTDTWTGEAVPIPRLAESWTTVPATVNETDGQIVTFKLRRNVKWHDGQPFTSADVKFTYEMAMKYDVSSYAGRGVAYLFKVETPDDYTVVVHLLSPGIFTVTQLGERTSIVPEHIWSKYEEPGQMAEPDVHVGTGPFEWVRSSAGEYIELARNPDYYLAPKPVQPTTITTVPATATGATTTVTKTVTTTTQTTITQADYTLIFVTSAVIVVAVVAAVMFLRVRKR